MAPLRAAQEKTRIEAEDALRAEEEAQRVRLAQLATFNARTSYTASYASTDGTTLVLGTYGYSQAWGNCVNEPGVNSPHDGTNPISWAVTSQDPWLGASVLFYFNHVAIVVGIWSNGDIEVRHQNAGGAPHRYPRSEIRGFR